MKKYFENTLKIIEHSISSIEEAYFEKLIDECIDTLSAGGKVIVSGLGKNVPVCEKFVGTMTSLGLKACYMNTNSAVHGDLGLVQSGDLVILLTKSGETSETIWLDSFLRKRDCIRWLITFNRESTLTREIPNHLVIKLEHEGDNWNIVPNNSTTLNLIVLQMLAMQISSRMDIQLKHFKENHPGGAIGEVLKNV